MHYNHRLQDVMVLSDSNYQVKVQIPSKNVSDEDRVQITFKKLAGSDDDEPIGRFEDSLGAFKQAAFHRVAKQWIPLQPSSPTKDNSAVLLLFYYGDKAQGSAALENELSRDLSEDTSLVMQGTPGDTPFGGFIDYSIGGTPARGELTPNNIGSTSQFSVHKSTDKKRSSLVDASHQVRRMTQVVAATKSILKNDSRSSLAQKPQEPEENGRFTARIPKEVR